MSDEPAVVDAEVVDEPGTELATVEGSTNLFRTDDPAEVLSKAQATADALMPVVRAKNLVANIQGREHLTVAAWQTLGAMLGVTPVCIWTRMVKDGWEARVEARTLDGRVIGAAEAECLRGERLWKDRDDFALRSMAQTRATSKALSSVLRFVATLAGVEGTPAEEMPGGARDEHAGFASDKQRGFVGRLLAERDVSSADRALALEWMETLPTRQISRAIDSIKDEDDAVGRLMAAATDWAAKRESSEYADDADLPEAD